MAADVREEENSMSTMQETQDDISSIYSNDYEPSYMIVQKQMRDLILSQNAAVEELVQSNIHTLNASKESFNSTVEGQEEEIRQLEKSIKNDFVSKSEYDQLKKELEENYIHIDKYKDIKKELESERCRHKETQTSLKEVADKLDITLEEVTVLTVDKQQDKAVLEERCDALGQELNTLQDKYSNLQSKFEDKFAACNQQIETITKQHGEIENLHQRQQQHKSKLRRKETDEEVQRQQQQYLRQALAGEDGRRGTRWLGNSVHSQTIFPVNHKKTRKNDENL